jgi:hypothetical protein
MTTVKELIKYLQNSRPEDEIVVSGRSIEISSITFLPRRKIDLAPTLENDAIEEYKETMLDNADWYIPSEEDGR